MPRAKTVTINGRFFPKQGEAQDHYNQLAKNLHASGNMISSGADFEELKEIYTLYCQYTNYELERLEQYSIVGFKGVSTARENSGAYSTTICLAVIFSNDLVVEFSVKDAIKEIATKQN